MFELLKQLSIALSLLSQAINPVQTDKQSTDTYTFGAVFDTPQIVSFENFLNVIPLSNRERVHKAKGQFIAGAIKKEIIQKEKYKIEIIDYKTREDGVEVFARAWQNGKQIGFGKDGSIDIERFVFVNPPILVPDNNGNIVRKWIDKDGNIKQRKLREDPKEAILQALEHTISVKKEKFDDKNIITGKIGRSTLTVYPDANPETTSVDGSTTRNNVLDTWAGIREGNGREAAAGNSADYVVYLISSGTSDRWDTLYRDAFLFDTSSLTDTVTINSATFSLYGTGVKSDAFSQSITLVSSNPNSNTELVSADYPIGRWGSTEFATRLAISSWNTSAYNDFSLNSNGIANISKTSISKFGTRISADFDNSPPIWQNVASSYARSYFAERTGTSQDPKLVVEYSVPVVSNPMQIIIFM